MEEGTTAGYMDTAENDDEGLYGSETPLTRFILSWIRSARFFACVFKVARAEDRRCDSSEPVDACSELPQRPTHHTRRKHSVFQTLRTCELCLRSS